MNLDALTTVIREAKSLIAIPGSDFAYSEWDNQSEALHTMDHHLALLAGGETYELNALQLLFAPSGSIQEVSMNNGWGIRFLDLAAQFQVALSAD